MALAPGRARGRLLALACLSMLATSGTGAHARAAVDLRVIDPTLPALAFGQGFEAIAEWIGKRLDRVYLPRIASATDGNERARLKARREQEIVLMQNAEAIFDGRNTGYELSIVASEFGVGTEESMFVYKEGNETHFFFMHQGRLWKYGRALPEGPSYLGRVASYQDAFGAPVASTDESDGAGGRRLLSVTWKTAGFDVRLIDKRTVYGTDLIVVEDRVVAQRIAAARAEKDKKVGGLGGVSPSLESFLLDDPDTYGAPPPPAPETAPDKPKRPAKRPR